MMRPSTSTTIWSAFRTVEVRCEIRIVVRPRITPRSPLRIFSSVCVSTLESESSRIRIRGSRTTARAMAVRCFCPPERVMPSSPTMVSYWGAKYSISPSRPGPSAASGALRVVIGQAESDIAPDGFAEQISILRHEANIAPQGLERPLANGAAVDQDLILGRFPKTCDECRERGLAAARGADDGKR